MAKPTYQDATVIVQLAQWAATIGLTEATNWLWSDQFTPDYTAFASKYPWGSPGREKAAKICGFFETVGTLSKYKLLNEDLLFDWLLVLGVWDRIKGYALGVRQEARQPLLYVNFEAMAKANSAWMTKQMPKSKGRKGG